MVYLRTPKMTNNVSVWCFVRCSQRSCVPMRSALSIERRTSSRLGKVRNTSDEGKGECKNNPHRTCWHMHMKQAHAHNVQCGNHASWCWSMRVALLTLLNLDRSREGSTSRW